MAREPAPWSVLRKRAGAVADRASLTDEFLGPALNPGDKLGKAAWKAWAPLLGAVCKGGRDPGVAWDAPVIPKMKRALKLTEAHISGEPKDNPRLARVVADLRSYRDTGYSTTSPERPGAAPAAKKKRA